MLAKQRLNRPVSPHLQIYKLDQTYLGSSAWMRITGCTLSGAAYVYFMSYLFAPVLGWHIDSAALVNGFANLPLVVKHGIKFGMAFPFTFHFFNGIKQLIYDMGYMYDKLTIKRADYYIWAVSVGGTLLLVSHL